MRTSDWAWTSRTQPGREAWERNGKRGMLGHPKVICWLLCFFLVVVQCFILTFDVLCGGGSGAIFLLSVHRFLFHYFVKSIVDVLS